MSEEAAGDKSAQSTSIAQATRIPDRITADNIEGIVANNEKRPAEMLQIIAVELSKAKMTNDILMSVQPLETQGKQKGDNSRLPNISAGSSAPYLTHEEHMRLLHEKRVDYAIKKKNEEEKQADAEMRKKARKSKMKQNAEMNIGNAE